MRSNVTVALTLAALAVILGGRAASASEPNCYDAEVTATIVRQTPTEIGDCGGDCIVMSWPWIVDLTVNRTHRGRMALGPVTVLTVQHSDYRTDLGARRWWLRQNTLGVYNVLRFEGEPPRLCPAGTPPAAPYIQPPDGSTLDDLRRAGERRYGDDRD